MPLDWEQPTPPILLPVFCIFLKIYRSNHFCYPTKLRTSIDLHDFVIKTKSSFGGHKN
ncbi:unnamed protein product, partial [Vitis vinifera]|uniref:Uncharacterized protein n=1 Tax=Vitis vinifera TaxID=29760 RepID=D7T0P6_VITVI